MSIKKITVYLDEDLHIKFKILCTKNKISQTEQISQFIKEFVEKAEEKEKIAE